jgi:hypothetical protein
MELDLQNEKMDSRAPKRTREADERPRRWLPPQLLPEPEPEEGWVFRWIRLSTLNNPDPINISSKLREGWEPVKAITQPKLRVFSVPDSRFPDCIEIGGLLLCKTPKEFAEQRDEYYRNQANSQMTSVDNNFMRENDPRMPLFNERRSNVTFGKGF